MPRNPVDSTVCDPAVADLNPNLCAIGKRLGSPYISEMIRSKNIRRIIGNVDHSLPAQLGIIREMAECIPEYVSNATFVNCDHPWPVTPLRAKAAGAPRSIKIISMPPVSADWRRSDVEFDDQRRVIGDAGKALLV
jgi:hypothetical protein